MKESVWQQRVVALAEAFSWKWWHVGAPMRAIGGGKFVPDKRAAGLCDLVLLHEDPPRLILAELKDEKHGLEPEQEEFLRLASLVAADVAELTLAAYSGEFSKGQVPVGVYVWRPSDELTVETILRSKVIA